MSTNINHYNLARPYRVIPLTTPQPREVLPARVFDLAAVRQLDVLGGLIHEYELVALLVTPHTHPRAMMEHLGHSPVTFTLDTYGHLMLGLEEKLTDGLDALHSETIDSPGGTSGA